MTVYSDVSKRTQALLSGIDSNFFSGRQVGLEKETLRVDSNGRIAQTDHPKSLGSALCNSQITTDFSEALLEMVTPPSASVGEALSYLTSIHQFILPRLEQDEGLWNTSMPCVIGGDNSIRIGQYGHSHNGMMKQAYRRGLGLRYGRRMQAIAGVHFNFSLPEHCWPVWQKAHGFNTNGSLDPAFSVASHGYFHMTRNLMRMGWIVPFLFGASPAICQTFLPSGADSDLATLNKNTRYAPFGTSLRMGEIGYRYKEDAPIDLSVRHDTFAHYLDDILGHVTTEHPAYKEQGLLDDKGQQQQLNANRLQIENEYYSSVRPKQIPQAGELPLLALRRAGIRYLELRSVDVNVFDPAGMHLEQLAMLEMLMLFAWLDDSSPLLPPEMELNKRNVQLVAHRGREPGLTLQFQHIHAGQIGKVENVLLSDWAEHILNALVPIAELLDKYNGQGIANNLYQNSLQQQMAKVRDYSLTPSAQVVDQLDQHGSFFNMAMFLSEQHAQTLLSSPINAHTESVLQTSVVESIEKQARLEAETSGSFADHLQSYFSQLDTVQRQGG